MPTHTGFDLSNLRTGIRSMYLGLDRQAARVRAAHLNEVTRFTPYAMGTNIGCAALVLWVLGGSRTPGLWLWAGVLTTLCALALLGWRRHLGRRRELASVPSVHRATLHAALLAGLWAVLLVLWFPALPPTRQLVLAVLFTGMLGAGTFMLSPLPLASMAYAAVFSVSAGAALLLSGEAAYLSVFVLLVFYALLSAFGALTLWHKATALLLSQDQAVRQEHMLAVLLRDFEQHAGDALWEVGPDGHLNHVSPRLAEMLGLQPADARRAPLLTLLAERCSEGVAALREAMNQGRPFRDLMLQRRVDHGVRHLALTAKRLADSGDRTLGWRGVMADITAKVEAENSLWRLAHTDSLTGLANRFTLRDALAGVLREQRGAALLMLDLDDFKSINDTHGHSVGDQLLDAVAARLRACVRPGDLVARLGGDEFAVLMTHSGRADDAVALAQRLVDALRQPLDLQGRRLLIGASVGAALRVGEGVSVDEWLVQADTALYAAKGAGRGQHVLYEAGMGERSRRRAAVEAGLRLAIERGELALHWQPKVDIERWQIVGAEALMRWQHPELGSVPPSEFIDVAETTGLIDELGHWALQEACSAAMGPLAGLVVSVNVSPSQLRDAQFPDRVRELLRRWQLEPSRLELEITESVFMDDAPGVLARLHALRDLGVRVALDDFGTGYSSLAYLRRFPFDTLKIDRAFVNEVLLRRDARAIVQTIAQLAVILGMRTVCEGVETQQQLAAVGQAGCDEVQGYLVSPPRPLAEFVRLRGGWRSQSPLRVALH
ncbi:MAG: EAL domain-containing protein [Rubrivivax sp.]|nr:EAL domain-containing protein [Rubrivivax sp.]